ncbi:MAG: type IX secretion system membrane protein PorP/SprF [Haliscomenobacter sp.]|nr:type IX secretion system membrane protein PorP/SprF [Haliscomenobacter sp.]MBK9488159.1 type IX secretion system membrane protein PorP/SprF [Haliscomenobacter sp.]
MLRIYFGSLFLIFLMPLTAQQLPYFTQFRQHQPSLNPASVSSDFFLYEYNVSLSSSYRMQWISHPETPRTVQVNGEFISDFGGAFELVSGISVMQDRTGPFGLSGIHGRIGSIFTNDPYFGGLSVGLSVGMVNYRVNSNRIIWKDLGDPLSLDIDFFGHPTRCRLRGILLPPLGGSTGWRQYLLGVIGTSAAAWQFPGTSGRRFYPLRRVTHYYATAGWYHFLIRKPFRDLRLGQIHTGCTI